MLYVLRTSWALLFGMLLLLLGNGLQGTLLGIRGAIEGFDAETMALVMSAYYVGFLLGSRRATAMIARVGHVRVFAALGSMIAAAFILYAAGARRLGLDGVRFCVGFRLRRGLRRRRELAQQRRHQRDARAGAVALHDRADGGHHLGAVHPQPRRSRRLHAVRDDVGAGVDLVPADPADPGTAPPFQTTKPMSLVQLYRISPLGCVGTFLLGGVYGRSSAWGRCLARRRACRSREISAFVAAIYPGGLVFQYPIGWVSDRMDRRVLIMGLTAAGALVTLAGALFSAHYAWCWRSAS